jgi:DNA helicase IV
VTAAPERHPDFDSEQAFLRHASRCLEEMRERRARLGDAGSDPKASAKLEEKRRAALERMGDAQSICFGRIDANGNGDGEGDRYYIGGYGIVDESRQPIVISWGAEAARPFYEATPEEPLGLALRRRFRTDRATLLGIADELFGDVPADEPTGYDILLEELGRERTAAMREIAATIQRDQYRIISKPLESTTIVQGGPGTGKTAVGLHRAALLLYRHRVTLTPSRVLIVGPNPVFMEYISHVLPALGETAADQVVVAALGTISGRRADEEMVARIKGDARMVEVLRRAVVDRVRPPEESVRFSANGVEFTVSAAEIGEAVVDFDPRRRTFNDARARFRAWFENRALDAYAEAYARSRPGLVATPLKVRTLPELDRALDRIWQSVTAPELVRQLLSSEERLERAASDVLTDSERRLLYRKPVERLDQVVWSASDVALVDEVENLIESTARVYGHVVLDEAQDLTPMQLRMVGRRIRAGSVTVLGDLAQATGLWTYAAWNEIVGHLGLEQGAEIEELTLAYRVPREVMDVALPVLQLTAPSIRAPQAFRDGGKEPRFLEVTLDRRLGAAVGEAAAAHREGGTAAIIAPFALLPGLRAELGTRGIEFGDAASGELATSIELLEPIAAKGLEFDHVILVEPAAVIREGAAQGHRQLYVALTRAMRTLTCVHSEPLPWPLGETRPEPPAGGKDDRAGATEVPDLAVDTAAPAPPSLSVGEALVLGRLRGISVDETLARALLARAAGADEQATAAAVLSRRDDSAGVRALLQAARHLARGPDESTDG